MEHSSDLYIDPVEAIKPFTEFIQTLDDYKERYFAQVCVSRYMAASNLLMKAAEEMYEMRLTLGRGDGGQAVEIDEIPDGEILKSFKRYKEECEKRSTPTRVILNTNFGGYRLTDQVAEKWKRITGIRDKMIEFSCDIKDRTDPVLISIIEKIGCDKAGADCSEITIKTINIPLGYTFGIKERGGLESINVYPK